MSKQYSDESVAPFIQIDVRVWDALDLYETRVYGHIKRRAGENSHCWESLPRMAKHIGISRAKLITTIKTLIEKGLLRKEKGEIGGTDRYHLTPSKYWVLGKTTPVHQVDYPPSTRNTTPRPPGRHKGDPLEVDPVKESPDPESLISITPESAHSDFEQTQNIPTYPLIVNPDPVDGEKGSAACSIIADKTKTIFGKTRSSVAQKQRAEGANWLSAGVANKRWKDRQDFDKFVSYVGIYAENRRQDPELNLDGTMYGEKYRAAILSHTATSQDENDPMLTCWKIWNLEPAPPNYIEQKPEEVAVVDIAAEASFQVNFANLKAANADRKAAEAAEKVRKDEIVRGLYES